MVPIQPADLDANGWLLNCSNGTLDLRTRELRKYAREDFLTKLCPVNYIADAECPLWLDFLRTIFNGNERLLDYIHRYFGYCLTADVREQVLVIFYGTGANGPPKLPANPGKDSERGNVAADLSGRRHSLLNIASYRTVAPPRLPGSLRALGRKSTLARTYFGVSDRRVQGPRWLSGNPQSARAADQRTPCKSGGFLLTSRGLWIVGSHINEYVGRL